MTETSAVGARGAAAIESAFRKRTEKGEKALVTYFMAGDPDLNTTKKLISSFSQSEVDVIELGVPFSDPLADGPVIQEAGQRALAQGATLQKTLDLVNEVRAAVDTPIVIMTYFNLFLQYGLERFAEAASECGVDGVIVPDLPMEEAQEFNDVLGAKGLAYIYLIAPTSSDERMRHISESARGFIYYVSRTGVTGMQTSIADDLADNLKRIRAVTQLPVAVGFGISSPEQAQTIAADSDGVVIGSAIVRVIAEASENPERAAADFVRPYIQALHGK